MARAGDWATKAKVALLLEQGIQVQICMEEGVVVKKNLWEDALLLINIA